MDRARHVIWPNQKNLYFSVIVINNKPILSSMLAAGVVLDTFAGEAGEGEPRRLSGDEATKAFVAIEFLSQITNTLTRIRNVRTYVHGITILQTMIFQYKRCCSKNVILFIIQKKIVLD